MSKENEKELFDVVLIVELQEENGGKIVPFISYRYPQLFETDNFTSSVTQFCFPDINQFPTDEMKSEIFSFVVTDGSGERRFGYCLRKLPPGSGLRFPTAYSILSYFPCYSLYTTIIDKVAYHYENSSMKTLSTFLQSMLMHRFPAPGQSFTVKIEESGVHKDFRFSRPDGADSQLEYVDVDPLLLQLNPTNILTIFLSLLFERRIIFCASTLSILSSCVQTAVAFLYPFTWQHIYIPVLPKSLLSFCCAPMPFVVGILASELNEVLSLPMDEVLIVNIDNDSFIRTPGTNDLHLLPQNYVDPLKNVVKASAKVVQRFHKKRKEVRKLPKNEADFQENQLLYEVKKQKTELKETFLEFFVYLFGSLRKHIGADNKFDSQGFIATQPPEIGNFMELLVGSQMFEMFIQDRIHTTYTDDSFEKAVSHREKLNNEFTRFYGAEVDGSLYKPTASKRAPKLKKSTQFFDTFKKGIKTLSANSDTPAISGPISGPVLVKATNDVITPAPPVHAPAPIAKSFTAPSPSPIVSIPFTPPPKPLPLPPSKQPVNNNNNNSHNTNEVNNIPMPTSGDVALRDRKAPVRHHHSTAVPLKATGENPPPPPRKDNFSTPPPIPPNPLMRGGSRGRVLRQRPQSHRPGMGDEDDEESKVLSHTFSTLRATTDRTTVYSTLRSGPSKNDQRPLPKPPI